MDEDDVDYKSYVSYFRALHFWNKEVSYIIMYIYY